MMIASIFLPKYLNSYYLLAHRIVGIEITKQAVYASIILHKGRSRVLEAVYTERLSGNDRPFDEQVVQALKNLKVRLGSFNEVYAIIPSSNAIFKELTLPFIGAKKVKIVIPFEVESQLPFNLADGIVDGLILGTSEEEQTTNVLVTAMKRDVIARYSGYFEDAELPLNKLSVGLLELYSLYQTFPQASSSSYLCIEMGSSETTVGLAPQGLLKYVRTLQKGLNLPNNVQADPENATKEQLAVLFDEIKLTTDIAWQKIAPLIPLNAVILTGTVTDLSETRIKEVASNSGLQNLEFLDAKKLLSEKALSSKVSSIAGSYLPSIALASAPPKTESFNLLQEKVQEEENRHITYQMYTIGALLLALFITFAGYSFFRIRILKNSYKAAEQEALNELKKQFKLPTTRMQRLDIANKAAQKELHKQETAWKRISAENRYAYVTYLAELTKCINMRESQLQLDTIILKDDMVKLYGSVPGYQQLTRLQDQLECPLFKKVPKLQAFNFKSEPITLVINQEALQ